MDKRDTYSGTGSVEDFLEKIRLHVGQKGYDGEKKIQCLASKLSGEAFQVYMRLSADDKKDYNKLETELRMEFKEGTSNREAALDELKGVKYKGHSIITHAYNIMELVKLANPTFNSAGMQLVATD